MPTTDNYVQKKHLLSPYSITNCNDMSLFKSLCCKANTRYKATGTTMKIANTKNAIYRTILNIAITNQARVMTS